MLLTIAAIIVLLWLLGVIAHIGGGLIYLLLVVALVLFIIDHLDRRDRRI